MNSACHQASKHAARAKHALVRELAGDGDSEFWRTQRFLHVAIAGRPISHADSLLRFAVVADANPLLPGLLKKISVHGPSTAAQAVQPAPPPSIS